MNIRAGNFPPAAALLLSLAAAGGCHAAAYAPEDKENISPYGQSGQFGLAHLLVTNQGMTLKGVDMSAMVADESQWNYAIDYIRVWQRLPAPPQSATGKVRP